MYSQEFLLIVLSSIFLNYLHGIECIRTKFWEVEPHFYFFIKKLKTIPESVYFVFHGWFWIFLLFAFCLLLGGRWVFIPLALYGTIFITEFHHFIKGIMKRKYYPGMITSFFFPLVGILYWVELIKMWR